MLPGVPALLHGAAPLTNALGNISHIANVLGGLLSGPVNEQWGVVDKSGKEVLQADTILSFDYRRSSRLVDYPLEQGGFATYNKVSNPYDVAITAAKGGSSDDLRDFMHTVRMMQESLDKYAVVLPQGAFFNLNLERYDHRRERQNGSHMAIMTLYFREVRETATVNGQPKQPDAIPNFAAGQVSPSPLSSLQSKLMGGAAGALAAVKAQAGLSIGAAQSVTHTAASLIGVMK